MSDLLDDVKTLRQRALERRRVFARSGMGRIARTLMDAMDEYHRVRAEGVSREDAAKGLELVLRDVIPLSRFPDASCGACDDTGWRETTCVHGMRCGRRRCGQAEPEWEHRYAVPCDCSAGDRNRRKAPAGAEDALVAVGKKRRSSGFTRVGRR